MYRMADSNDEEQRILLTQAAPGMVLSRPVAMPNRVNLCPAGTTLSDSLITKLMNRGIKRIHVRGRPLPAPSLLGFAERLRQLRERFSRCRGQPGMGVIESMIEKEVVRRS